MVERAPVRELSPRRGRKILSYSSNLITLTKKMSKFWSFHQSITPSDFFPQNFPGHARYLIRKPHIFFWVLDNPQQNLLGGSKDMLTFVKFSNKYVRTILRLDFPCSCAIKYYSSRRESILSIYKLIGEACSRQGAKPPAGPQKFALLFESDHFFNKKCQNLVMCAHLDSIRTFSTEFSWTC